MTRVYLHALGILNALGNDAASVRRGLYQGATGGMRVRNGLIPGRSVHVGAVHADLPPIAAPWAAYASRNNQLLQAASE